MIPRAMQRDRIVGWTILSFTIHLLTILIFNNAIFPRSSLPESTPYYVDIVSLPSADPAPSGSESSAPVPVPAPAQLPVAAQQPLPAQKPAMVLPATQKAPTVSAAHVTPATPPPASSPAPDQVDREQEAREFSEKMRRLEQRSEARRQADTLATLQKRIAEKKSAGGGPKASGSDKGSDYGAYVQSRLKDSLSSNLVYRSQNPEAAVHLYIDKTGKLIRYVMVRPSDDKLFNNSIIRTIEKAKADFPPVPSGTGFDKLYVFSPQEVKK